MDEETIKTKTIGIMGTPVSSGNRGVLALGSSLASLCLDNAGADRVALFLGNRTTDPFPIRHHGESIPLEVVNFRLSPKSKWNQHLLWIVLASILFRCLPFDSVRKRLKACTPWVKAVDDAAIIGDVRGGDSFSDIYGMQRFLIAFLPVWSVILVKGSIVQYPQTYGPYKSRLARWLAGYLLRRSSKIVARDTKSQAVAQELVSDKQTVDLSPDVAFSLRPIRPESIDTIPANSGCPTAQDIGINVNGLMYNGGYTRNNMFGLKMDYPSFLKELVTTFLERYSGDVWLVPHTYAPKDNVESDNEACEKLRNALPAELQTRVKIVASEHDQYEIKGIIGMCGFFVGSRMHSCIAALSQGIPCIGVAYSMKFLGVFESVGVGDWVVDARDYDNRAAIEACLALYEQKEAASATLKPKVAEAKEKLKKVFQDIGRQAGCLTDRESRIADR